MSEIQTQMVDEEARLVLPKRFAGASVVVLNVSENEVRVRKMTGDLEVDTVFCEESVTVLSDRDRDRFLDLLENPPPPNEALAKLFAEHRKQEIAPTHP